MSGKQRAVINISISNFFLHITESVYKVTLHRVLISAFLSVMKDKKTEVPTLPYFEASSVKKGFLSEIATCGSYA